MTSPLPRSSNSAFSKINDIIKKGWIEMPDQYKGTGAPGNTLEHLLNLEVNNKDSPDLDDWEVKFHGGNALLTLFHKEPKPKGVINKMVEEFGWLNDKGQLSFRTTIRGSNDNFNVVSRDNTVIVENSLGSEVIPHWDHNTLMTIFGAKLRRLILVHGQVKNRKVIYESAMAYWDPDIINVCQAFENGTLIVDFDARTKAGSGSSIRNHGTKCRIKIADIDTIYESNQLINGGLNNAQKAFF